MADTPNFNVSLACFANLSDKNQQELLEKRQSKHTREQTRVHMNILRQYMEEKQLPKVEDIPNEDLPNLLKSFYSNVQRVDTEMYKLARLKCI